MKLSKMSRPLGSKNKKNSAEKPKAIENKTKNLANATAESGSNTTTVAPSSSGYSLRNRINRNSRQSESNEVDAVQNTVTSGTASTGALKGSTEEEQFH